MRHFHGHFHGKNGGVKVSSAREQERHFHGAYFYMPVKVRLSVREWLCTDLHGHFHELEL